MKKDIQKMIPAALKAVERYLLTENKVQKEYDGYAASLGAAIRSSGLVPALCFYTDISRDSGDANRWRVLMAVNYVITGSELSAELNQAQDRKNLLNTVISAVYGNQNIANANVNPANENNTNRAALHVWKKDILNASIALKLAMRNFPHTKNEDN